tara:strand:- start:4566 stop:4808 length:243 start_codon:yes stop_codon:yes gene_type:complete
MNWVVVVLFATIGGDVFVFNKPTFETREECMAALVDPESRDAMVIRLVEEYKRFMPIQLVNCITEEKAQEIIELYTKTEI